MARSIKLAALVFLMIPAVAQAKNYSYSSVPDNKETYASVGDVLVKITLKDSLPNAFGGADIFGRKRERGFIEIRYMGIGSDGRAIFRRKSVDIQTNETTLSGSQALNRGSSVYQGGGGNNNIAIVGGYSGGDPTVESLPADTIQFSLDLSKNHLITIQNRLIEIRSADEGGVTFVVRAR